MKFIFTRKKRLSSQHSILFLFLLTTGLLFGINYSGFRHFADERGPEVPDSVYVSIITRADGFFLAKKYGDALAEYEKAQKINPSDEKLKEKITALRALIQKQASVADEYRKAVASGDNYFKAKDYLNAKSAYQMAIDLNPEEPVAKEKLKQTMDLLRSQKAQNTLYDMAIASAEKFFQAKDYEKAKTEFEKAVRISPSDAYAKQRINEIIRIMVDLQEKEENYAKAIAAADNFFNAKNYQNALTEYKNASAIKPEEKYPKEKITELNALIAAIKAKNDAYNKAITAADKAFTATLYTDARKEYQNALVIKPEEIYPRNRIREIDDILAGKERLKENFDRLVNAGDSLYIEKKYVAAKANYQQALKLKPEDAYPRDMIAKAEKMIAGQEASAQATEEAYQAAIKTADEAFAGKAWEQARSGYENAQLIKPDMTYPGTRIAEIEKILAETAKQKSLEEQYQALLTDADKKLEEKAYQQAKEGFQSALKIRPDQQYPKDKIAGIDKILADAARQKSLDDQYNATIVKADRSFAANMLAQAKTEYLAAGTLKPDEGYPKQKITEIEQLLSDAAAKKALDDSYNSIIANADKLFAAKSYSEARAEYSAALDIKPAEQYPKDKIAGIDQALTALADAKARDEQYTKIIREADQLFNEQSWEKARSEYQGALAVKPEEAYPKTRIGEIEEKLAAIAKQLALDDQYSGLVAEGDRLITEKSWAAAKARYESALKLKPGEQYPKERIAEADKALGEIAAQKALNEQYAEAIAKADQSFAADLLPQAKAEYEAAGTLKPEETYPKQKIAEIEQLLTDAAAKKALDEKYNSVITNADKLLAEKSYSEARLEYSSAASIKPSEQYPKDKIAEIDKTLATIADAKAKDEQYAKAIASADKLFSAQSWEQAKSEYLNASSVKPDETYPKTRIAEIDLQLDAIAKQKELDGQYETLIRDADAKLAGKFYDEARLKYQSASELKPDQTYPRGKITEIDKALADIARQKATDEKYAASIARADQLLADKMLDEAKAEYQNAGLIKPSEAYPKQKIAEVDRLKTEAAQKKALDDKYDATIQNADKLLAQQNYILAKSEYANASQLKPSEQYPKEKAAEIDGILAEIKAKEDAYNAAIAKADQLFVQKSYEESRNEYNNASLIKPSEQYPKSRTAEINKILMQLKGKKETYDGLVQKGDDLFSQQDFYRSKDNFEQASEIFPEETYPKQRLARLNVIIDSIYRANKGKYDKAVADGDKAFNSFIYDNALDFYGEALSYLPNESYPKEMISKIKKAISENAIVDLVSTTIVIPEGTEKQIPFQAIDIASRKNNYLYIKIRNLSKKPFNVLVRYGKDKQLNGGAVIRNLQADGNVYDRLISVRNQDPWYREDNNWIALLPQGGDVEVTFIQISRAAQ